MEVMKHTGLKLCIRVFYFRGLVSCTPAGLKTQAERSHYSFVKPFVIFSYTCFSGCDKMSAAKSTVCVTSVSESRSFYEEHLKAARVRRRFHGYIAAESPDRGKQVSIWASSLTLLSECLLNTLQVSVLFVVPESRRHSARVWSEVSLFDPYQQGHQCMTAAELADSLYAIVKW